MMALEVSSIGRRIAKGAVALAFAVGVIWGADGAPASAGEVEDVTSMVRGGRLYDDWIAHSKEPVPKKAHPAYPAGLLNSDDPYTTWRCTACHGWDYKGKDGAYAKGINATGIKGIFGMAGAAPDKVAAVLTDKTHGFDSVLDADDIRDLAMFVSKGQIDIDAYVDPANGKIKGDPKRHQDYYYTICASCHGPDGRRLRSLRSLGAVSRDDPWSAMHKILNGHPDEAMPALRVLGIQNLADILAFIQTLPGEEELSSIARGGRLYDNWVEVVDAIPPLHPHPAYPSDGPFAHERETTWRCKECHGWDYKGADGQFNKDSVRHNGIKGIRGLAGGDPHKVMITLKDRNHRFDRKLADRDLLDIANFVVKGQVDMDKYIDAKTRKFKGDPSRHKMYYHAICGNCHGPKGGKIITTVPLGRHVDRSPWNALHKILNGHPAEDMPSLRVLKTQDLVDLLAYIQTLPKDRKSMH